MSKKLLFSLSKDAGDFVVQTFRSGGPGGQNQNRRDTGVRVIHPASGATGESRSERTQLPNRKLAFQHLIESPKFRIWMKKRTFEATSGITTEEIVDKLMQAENMRTDIQDDKGRWVEATDDLAE